MASNLTRWMPALAAALLVVAASGPARAQFCGPVERYVSVRAKEVNVRAGPGVKYPVEWVFTLKAMPLAVIAEYEHWRRVCDWQGTTGWVHRAMLSSKRTVIVTAGLATLRREPADNAPAVARLEAGVIGELSRCEDGWCRVSVEGYRGWLPAGAFWGVESTQPAE